MFCGAALVSTKTPSVRLPVCCWTFREYITNLDLASAFIRRGETCDSFATFRPRVAELPDRRQTLRPTLRHSRDETRLAVVWHNGGHRAWFARWRFPGRAHRAGIRRPGDSHGRPG